jgi:hypothetical protein
VCTFPLASSATPIMLHYRCRPRHGSMACNKKHTLALIRTRSAAPLGGAAINWRVIQTLLAHDAACLSLKRHEKRPAYSVAFDQSVPRCNAKLGPYR